MPRFYYEPQLTLLARPAFAAPEHLPVNWLGESTDGERLAEFAGRLCYMSQANPAKRATRDYLENIKRQGHGSVLEHANYSVLLEGVSRSLTHELVRHRAGFAYCLSGSTVVYSEHRWDGIRNGTRKSSLRELYEMTKTPHGRSRLELLRLSCLDEASGTFTTGRVRSVVRSGVKPVFRVELEDGKHIESTRDHRFLTPTGWQRLEDVLCGLTVSASGVVATGHVNAALMVSGTPAYRDAKRYQGGWRHSAETHARLAAQKRGDRNPAWRGGTARAGQSLRAAGLEQREVVFARGAGRLLVARPRRVVRVTYLGERETFDIEMEGPNHNFVANGIVTHNSQLSQRYVDESSASFVVPPAVVGDEALEAAWRVQVEAAQRSYVELVEQLMGRYAWVADKVHRRKMAREAARAVLPNSTETKIVVTGNARAWRTMLELRASEGAELEIRRAAVAVLRLLQAEAPGFFSDFEIYQADDRREAARLQYHKV